MHLQLYYGIILKRTELLVRYFFNYHRLDMLTREKVLELFDYCPNTGLFTQKTRRSGPSVPIGGIVGYKTMQGYLGVNIDGKSYLLRRLAFLCMEGKFPEYVDHIDTDRTNNKWSNLRPATASQNGYNKIVRSGTKLGIKGLTYMEATFRYGKRYPAFYKAQLQYDKKKISKTIAVSKGKTEEEIIKELTMWLVTNRKQLHGEYANNG